MDGRAVLFCLGRVKLDFFCFCILCLFRSYPDAVWKGKTKDGASLYSLSDSIGIIFFSLKRKKSKRLCVWFLEKGIVLKMYLSGTDVRNKAISFTSGVWCNEKM